MTYAGQYAIIKIGNYVESSGLKCIANQKTSRRNILPDVDVCLYLPNVDYVWHTTILYIK
jgi:hypothetical protein